MTDANPSLPKESRFTGPFARILIPHAPKLAPVLAVAGALLVTGAALSAAFFVTSLHESELNAIRNRLEIPAQAIGHVAQSILRITDDALQAVQAATQREGNALRTDPHLRELLVDRDRTSNAINKIEIYDATGAAILSSVTETPARVSVAGYKFFQRQVASQDDTMVLSELVSDPSNSQPTIIASRPIRGPDGRVRGVVAAYLDTANLQQIFDSLDMPAGASLTLFNWEGRQLVRSPARPSSDHVFQTDYSQNPVFREFRENHADSKFGRYSTISRMDRFIAGGADPGDRVVVTASWEVSAALAHWRNEAGAIIAGTFVGIVVIIALFAYILRALHRNDALIAQVSNSEEGFRDLLTGLPDAVIIVNGQVRIEFANSGAEQLFGYSPGEMNGLPLRQIMTSSMLAIDEESLRSIIASKDYPIKTHVVERVTRRKDGSDVPVEIHSRRFDSLHGSTLVAVIRDSSRRLENDRALRRSRENLNRAQKMTALGSFDRDLRTNDVEYSDELYRIWGIAGVVDGPAIEFMASLVHPADRARFLADREAVLKQQPGPMADFRIIRPDGEQRILHHEYTADFDENGTPIRLFGTVQDITERKKIETELRRSQENLARAQRIAGLGSFDRDLGTGDLHYSEEFIKIWGLPPGSPAPSHDFLATLVHPEDRQKFGEGRVDVLHGKPAPHTDFRFIRPDGVERTLHAEYGADFDESGKPVRFFGTVQDITERKKIETALRSSREDLARAQRVAGIGSFSRNLKTGVIEWSDEFLRIWGISEEGSKVTAETLAALVHPEDRQKFLSGRNEALETKAPMPLDFRVIRPDGEERILHREYGIVADEDGKPLRMFGTVQDITERKRSEMALRRSRENLARAQRIARVGSFERNLTSGEVEGSDELYRIHGVEPGTAQASIEFLYALVHPDDVEKIETFRRAAAQGTVPPPIDYRIIRPDGAERVLHRECDLLFDESGKPTHMFGTMQDITELKRAERELRRSQENLKRAQQIAALGSFDRDLRTGKTEWSEEFIRIWGITPDHERGSAEVLNSLVHPEDRQRFIENRDAALNNRPVPDDFRIVRPDGAERVLHREYAVIFDDKGNPVRSFGIVQDITDRKQNELALRRSRENLARAQRIAGIGSFERDLVTGEWEWSDELYRLHGIERGDPNASIALLRSLVVPEDRPRFDEVRNLAAKGIVPPAVDFRIKRPDGAERIMHRECELLFNESGKPARLIATVQDVTEQRKAEFEVRRSRENMARAQRIAGMGSFERDFLTNEPEWSDEMYRVLGIEKGEAPPGPETLMKLVHPDDRDRVAQFREGEIAGQPTAPIEYRIIRPDGAERVMRRESAIVFSEENRPIRIYGTLQDITERRLAERRERELERQLLHSQKLEALGTLAGGIAHDLNNTLVPIMALSKITARRFESGSPVRANLETIFEASERARDLVKRVVAFSRKDESEKSLTNIADTVREALKLLRATIPSSISLEAKIGEVPSIPADGSQIHQIVTNLVSNASQAIGGEIGTIKVTLDHLRSPAPAGEIRFTVSDTGVGMDEATQQRIFEPFFTTKPVGQGTGLGLSIVHGIVAGYGGRIEVKSAPGRGTRFELYFPVPGAAPQVTSSRPAA